MADRPVLDVHPLDARPAFPEAEITGPDLRVRPVPRPALTSLYARQGVAAMADQAGAYGLLALEGAGVRDLLARGAALDLDDRAFPQGAAATFSLGHFGAILWRRPGPHQFRLALARSTAGDAWRFLAHAAESLAACAAPPRP